MTFDRDDLLKSEYRYFQRKYKKKDINEKFPSRWATVMTKGWAFTDQSREDHDKEVEQLETEAQNWLKSCTSK